MPMLVTKLCADCGSPAREYSPRPRAADEVRAEHQPEDHEVTGSQDSTVGAGARRRGDPV